MMKKITGSFSVLIVALVGLLFVSTSVSAIAPPDCRNLKGCERKFCEIERQLDLAQGKGDERKAAGLKRSLANAKKNCTDKGLKEDLVEKIEKAKEEIAEYRADLKEAEKYGKKDKVGKYQEKIDEEKSKIERLEGDLADFD